MKTAIILLGCVIFLTCALCAVGDGFLIAEPVAPYGGPMLATGAAPHPLSVQFHRASVHIHDRVARTEIVQQFRNERDTDLEGTYIFPIPDEAAVTDFMMTVDGKMMRGQLLDSDEARRVYEDIVRKMKDPGLLEYMGRGMYRVRVYPIRPGGSTRIEIAYSQVIQFDAGTYRYVYPLDTERFSPLPLEEVSVVVDIKSSAPIKSVYCPSHEVDTELKKFRAKIGYEEENLKPDKDFVLYYTVSERDIGMSVLCHRDTTRAIDIPNVLNSPDPSSSEDLKGSEILTQSDVPMKTDARGYFLMLISPGSKASAGSKASDWFSSAGDDLKPTPKDVVFVLDTSGSMRGIKIEQAKAALRFCIQNLRADDRFGIVQFATTVQELRPALQHASSETSAEAMEFIDSFEARGGTNIHGALEAALRLFENGMRPRMALFITDGEPTVGETDTGLLLKSLSEVNSAGARVFVFGVGVDVNAHLLDRIAEAHRGRAEYVLPGEDLDRRVSSLFRKISEPVLSDVQIDFGRIRVSDLYPVMLPDIFDGEQILLMGRYSGDGETTVTLTGSANGRIRRISYNFNFPEQEESGDFIPRLWAARKIGYLVSEIRLRGEKDELVNEIVRLSTEYGIVTPYSSYLIIEREPDFVRWGIPGNLETEARKKGERYMAAMSISTGDEAVTQSLDILSMKERAVIKEPDSGTVKYVGVKTFYLRDGVWVDGTYREGMDIEHLKFLSHRYFELLREGPAVARYLASGKNVILVFGSKCYRIIE